jgi:hypothetical protein
LLDAAVLAAHQSALAPWEAALVALESDPAAMLPDKVDTSLAAAE